jgi:hypothetical protein
VTFAVDGERRSDTLNGGALPKLSKYNQSNKYRKNEDYTKVIEKTLKY